MFVKCPYKEVTNDKVQSEGRRETEDSVHDGDLIFEGTATTK